MFETIILVDIAHPRQIINKSKKYPKFKLISVDISGVLENLSKETKKRQKMIYYMTLNLPNRIFYVIQLPIL